MVISYKLHIDGQWMKVYMLIIYIIHVESDDIMLSHHLWLDVACDFTYATNGILVIHVNCNLILIANWDFSFSRKILKSFNA
jgi:hypothetical protein